MKIEGAVALVIGTPHAMGAALVPALLARGAAKVYAAPRSAASEAPAGTLPAIVDAAETAQMIALARGLEDVTLLVVCAAHLELKASLLAVARDAVPGPHQTPADRTLRIIDAFAPVLAANGGGAVVSILSAPSSGAWDRPSVSHGESRTLDWVPSEGLRDRLAAQGTELLFFRAALVDAGADDFPQVQSTLADHVAKRVLAALEAGDRPARRRPGPN